MKKQNYKESKEILEIIKNNDSFVMFCHESTNFDSIISCLLLEKVLKKMGKKVSVFSKDEIKGKNEFLDPNKIIVTKDPKTIDFGKFDVLFTLDISDISRIGLDKNFEFPGTTICIDHHNESDFADFTLFERDSGGT